MESSYYIGTECLTFSGRTTPSFGDSDSLHETSLGLLKVDDVPNRA